jgi:site-specific DNA-methyltransferase (adenine-specific)
VIEMSEMSEMSEMGLYYEDDYGKLYHGDCLEVMKDIEDNSIDLIVTDPPYKIISGGCTIVPNKNEPKGIFNRREKRKDWSDNARSGKLFNENDIKFEQWIPEMYRVLKDGTHFYTMCNDRNMQNMLNISIQSKFKLVNILAWKKNNCTPNRYYMKNMEFILMFRKGSAKTINNIGTKQCLEFDNIKGKLHPTEKPIDLIKTLVENSSNENNIVLDPFVGSGSTLVACKNTNRKYIGIEKDEKYCEIAKQRLIGG